jgi:hypothetical protein
MTPAKPCRVCGRAKSPEMFAIDPKSRDGRSGQCKACMAAYTSARYQRMRREGGDPYTPRWPDEVWQEIEARGVLQCKLCGKEKPLVEFRVSARPPRRRRKCKECERQRMAELHVLKRAERAAYYQRYRCRLYGITPADYDRMLAEQGGRCAICRKPLGPQRQTIDHCHKTGRVRGIVHSRCNLVIGNAGEDVEVLRGAIRYLFTHANHSGGDTSGTQAPATNGSFEEGGP